MLAPRKTLWSTPPEVIEVAITALKIEAHDIVFDVGAGDGRFLTTCAKKTGACCTGIEINTDRVQEAMKTIQEEGLEDKCTMIAGNALEQDFSTATVFYLYLIPRGLRIILPVLKALRKKLRVITYMSPFPESETPIETFQVTSVKHPDAQWPLFLYDILPDEESSQQSSGVESQQEDRNTPIQMQNKEKEEVHVSSKSSVVPPLSSGSAEKLNGNDEKVEETVFRIP